MSEIPSAAYGFKQKHRRDWDFTTDPEIKHLSELMEHAPVKYIPAANATQQERDRIAGIIQQMIDARRARAGMDIGVESIKAKDQIEFGETILRCLRGGVV